MEPLRIGTLGAARITEAALITPARRAPEAVVTAVAARDRAAGIRRRGTAREPFPTTPEHAVVTMELIDDVYRAAGLPLRP
jgi:hypothetical protein